MNGFSGFGNSPAKQKTDKKQVPLSKEEDEKGTMITGGSESEVANDLEDRIEFLAERYNVLDSDDLLEFVDYVGDKKVIKFMDEIIFVYEDVFKKSVIYKGDVINKYKRTIWISEYSFINIVESDPTLNKVYTQWIILLFINHIKNDELDEAVRLVLEDLVGLNELLSKYDEIKNRKDFIRLARLKLKISLPSDINKFTSIGELFSGVDPFIERDVSDFKKKILNLESIDNLKCPSHRKVPRKKLLTLTRSSSDEKHRRNLLSAERLNRGRIQTSNSK